MNRLHNNPTFSVKPNPVKQGQYLVCDEDKVLAVINDHVDITKLTKVFRSDGKYTAENAIIILPDANSGAVTLEGSIHIDFRTHLIVRGVVDNILIKNLILDNMTHEDYEDRHYYLHISSSSNIHLEDVNFDAIGSVVFNNSNNVRLVNVNFSEMYKLRFGSDINWVNDPENSGAGYTNTSYVYIPNNISVKDNNVYIFGDLQGENNLSVVYPSAVAGKDILITSNENGPTGGVHLSVEEYNRIIDNNEGCAEYIPLIHPKILEKLTA